jgi:hypothetical protein
MPPQPGSPDKDVRLRITRHNIEQNALKESSQSERDRQPQSNPDKRQHQDLSQDHVQYFSFAAPIAIRML